VRGRLGFLFLVAFFTVFGAGKSHYWDVVTVDQAGWVYAVDLYSVTVSSPSVIRCKVLATHPERGQVTDTWVLDAQRRLLTRRSVGQAEQILPGSVAERSILFFRQRGDLPVLGALAGEATE
jgi:hypothetical protein